MNVAVFGGSFDPVHRGHVAMVDLLLGRSLADEVLLVPAGRSPDKAGHSASGAARAAMLELAFAQEPRVTVESCELAREGPSYTVQTLEELALARPAARLQLVLGQDNLTGFYRWRSPQRILDLAGLVVFARADSADPMTDSQGIRDLLQARGLAAGSVVAVADFDVAVSSRAVRAKLQNGRPDPGLVPEAVAAYIRRHGLYRS